ncbi:MAG TPA: DUF1634 domain-containing protein [Pseudacidobacterium sp.]|jgi:uncharacterized membrane protein|nr:DUF1634 domain-containing protein [Pseudacidobacterium sp.]
MNDQKMEVLMGNLLRIGVSVAALVVFIGGVLYLYQSRGPRPDYSTFHGEAQVVRSLSGIVKELPSGDSGAVIQLGLLLLIATPIARVVFAVLGFSLERDWFYVLVSLIVLGVLMYSLLYDR